MGYFITITGPTGSGKSTIAKRLLEVMPCTHLVTSLTTRHQCDDDLPGEYMYVSKSDLDKIDGQNGYLWRVTHGEFEYATPTLSVDKVLQREGSTGVMILVPEAVGWLREHIEQTRGEERKVLSLFIMPVPSSILVKRLRARPTWRKALKKMESESRWLSSARASGIPFTFINNSGPLSATIVAIRSLLP